MKWDDIVNSAMDADFGLCVCSVSRRPPERDALLPGPYRLPVGRSEQSGIRAHCQRPTLQWRGKTPWGRVLSHNPRSQGVNGGFTLSDSKAIFRAGTYTDTVFILI